MVKKIDGNKPGTNPTERIEPSKPVQAGKVGNVSNTQATTKKAGADKVQGNTRQITAKEREELFNLIREEADKMFGPDGLPQDQRKTVEEAVRKTFDAAIIDEE